MKKGICSDCVIIVCLLSLLLSGCDKEKLPKLSTSAVTGIEPTRAVTGGVITDDGNADIIVRGVCWGTKKSPTIEGTRTTDGYGTGSYVSTLTFLTPNTLYYVRAYATNSVGTAYGNQVTFTSNPLSVATLTTSAVTSVTQNTAISGGSISLDGGSAITARGICWSTHETPTVVDSKTTDGSGTGSFISNMTGLTGNTKYYLRAYATNSVGVAYGQEISFTTSPVLPVVTTSAPVALSTTTGSGGGNVTSDGGSAVSARGVCWSTSPNPSVTGSKTTNGAGTGTFTSSLTGLIVNTLYYVRAYATNSVGTAYGQEMSFRTDPAIVKDFDNNDYHVVRVGTQLWTKENLKTTSFTDGTPIPLVSGIAAWQSLSTAGYCWYENNSTEYKDVYGALYNWFTIEEGNICPEGWHVPTDNDWIILENYLGGSTPAGGKSKETGTVHWKTPNTGATNVSGLTALPGGQRLDDGTFEHLYYQGFWWTSTVYPSGTTDAWSRRMQHDSDKIFRSNVNKGNGQSVRCVRD